MGTLWQDLRYGLRVLLKQPGFTLIAVATLALGVGANTAIFSVVNAVLLQPLPLPEPERLVDLSETFLPNGWGNVSVPNLEDWKRQNEVLDDIAAYTFGSFNLRGAESPQRVSGLRVTANYFDVLGARPQLGRGFLPGEDRQGNDRVVVLSDALWRRDFAADPQIVNRTIPLNGQEYTVVGVMPPELGAVNRAQLWAPLAFSQKEGSQRGHHAFSVVGRLRPGVSVQAASAQMNAIANRLEAEYPDTNIGRGVRVTRLDELMVSGVRRALVVMMAAVGFVLLIACTNVANLMLARAARRHREIAIRIALGAGGFRLVRQFLTEGLLVSFMGGALGVLLAWWGVGALSGLAFPFLPRAQEIQIDVYVLAFTLLVSALTGVLFGLVPALQSARTNVQESLKDGAGSSAVGGAGGWLRSLLVVAEVASAFVLLIGAGLMIKSFARLQAVEPGLRPENVLTARLSLPAEKYEDAGAALRFHEQLTERLSGAPGVEAVGLTTHLPVQEYGFNGNMPIEGKTYPPNQEPLVEYRVVSPGYFAAAGIPLLRGRNFDARDREGAPLAALVNETMAKQVWPGEDPVGKRVDGSPEWTTVIGVVGDVKNTGLSGQTRAEMYWVYTQGAWSSWRRNLRLVVRSRLDEGSLTAAVRREVQSLDPALPLYGVQTMGQVIDSTVSSSRLNMTLLAVFAAVALLLAVVGIYGVMSYTVTQHTREIGIRMALGAQRGDILKLVVGRGMFLTVIGVAAGAAGAFALTRFISGLLFDVSTTDPATFGVITAVLAAVGLAACLVPARRATKVDPMVALRYE